MIKEGIKICYFYNKLDKKIRVAYGNMNGYAGVRIILGNYFIVFFTKDFLFDYIFNKENNIDNFKHKKLLYFYNRVKNWSLI